MRSGISPTSPTRVGVVVDRGANRFTGWSPSASWKTASLPARAWSRGVERVARGVGVGSAGQGVGRLLGYATHASVAWMYGRDQLGFYALGITVVQVTHSEVNASYGQRIIQIVDGWITSDNRTDASVTTAP